MSKEETLLLWVLCASNNEAPLPERRGSICPTYARTEIEARQQCNSWMAEQVILGLGDIEAKCYPGGYLAGQSTWWPGRLPQSKTEETSHELRHNSI